MSRLMRATAEAPLGLSQEYLRESAYLVARGVRPLALAGHCAADALTMLGTSARLQEAAEGTIPFVVDRGDGVADFGYAARPWALDLYRWAVTNDAVPELHRHRIVGLLLGYGADAVTSFEDQGAERLLELHPLTSESPAATSPPDGSGSTAGRCCCS